MKNKKTWIKILGIICFLVILFLVVYLVFQFQKKERERKEQEKERKLVQEIKESFDKEVQTTSKKKIYQKKEDKYVEVGFVDIGIFIPLEENKINTSKDIYFKIQDLDYYVDYKNLEKISHIEDYSLDRFVSVKSLTTEKTELYKGENLVFSFPDSYTFDVLLEVGETYYVKFLGDIYSVKGAVNFEDKEVNPLLEKLSVFQFSDDISNEKVEEVLSLFKEREYVSLTKSEFSYWMEGQGKLPEKMIFLIGNDSQKEKWKDLLEKYGFFIETNLEPYFFHEGDQQLTVGASKHYHYLISNSTTKDRILEMLAGIPKKVEKPKTTGGSVAVLNYHFFYDAATESCNESICISTENFRKQLDYLKNNGYKTLTMQEFYDWKMGNITIPEKSVLLTIDDGAMGTDTHLPTILSEYQMHASLFLITGWWDISKYQKTPYLEIYSHGDELHHNDYCAGSNCGFKPLLLSKDEIVADLNLSLSKGVGKLAFCYPFYKTSQTLETALREVGIPLAFAGGNRKATRSVSNYYIPRYVVYKGTSLNQFINMIS